MLQNFKTVLVISIVSLLTVLVFPSGIGGAQEPRKFTAANVIGEAFTEAVTGDEFLYYYKTAAIFTRTGEVERSEEAVREEAWQNLVFLQEAKRLDITVSRQELEEELKRLLSEKDVEFGGNEYNIFLIKEFDEDRTGSLRHRR